LATKNFIPSSTYGRRKGSAPGGIWYFSARSHPSRPAASLADKIAIWYSPTVNCASIVTPKSSRSLLARVRAAPSWARPVPKPLLYFGSGTHGSFSQYSTRRGAPI
jgi:hypothetical protein